MEETTQPQMPPQEDRTGPTINDKKLLLIAGVFAFLAAIAAIVLLLIEVETAQVGLLYALGYGGAVSGMVSGIISVIYMLRAFRK